MTLDIYAPNEAGEAYVTVKWMTETPNGWVGSYDKAALEQFNVTTPEQFKLPELTSKVVNDVCWEVVKQLPEPLSPVNFNNFKQAMYAGLKLYHEQLKKGETDVRRSVSL